MTETTKSAGMLARMKSLYCRFEGMTNSWQGLAALAARLVMARMFLKSGMSKVQDFSGTVDLFEYEYFEGIPHALAIVSGFMASLGETVLPLMLIVGFMTRFASAGLLAMTLIISIFVYPFWSGLGVQYWWNDHVWWTVILFALMAYGGGNLSLDAMLGKKR